MAKHGHFEKLARLLELEATAEAEQLAELARRRTGPQAERSGNCLIKLAIRDEEPAFGGRVVVTVGKRDQTQELPWNRLSVGTPVLLTEEHVPGKGMPAQRGWRGLVSRRDRATLNVVLTQSPESEQDRPMFRLDVASDEIARQRIKAAIMAAGSADRGRLMQLRDCL